MFNGNLIKGAVWAVAAVASLAFSGQARALLADGNGYTISATGQTALGIPVNGTGSFDVISGVISNLQVSLNGGNVVYEPGTATNTQSGTMFSATLYTPPFPGLDPAIFKSTLVFDDQGDWTCGGGGSSNDCYVDSYPSALFSIIYSRGSYTISGPTVVPIPSAVILLGSGVAALFGYAGLRGRRERQAA